MKLKVGKQVYFNIYASYACSAAKSYPTLCNLMESSPPGSSVHETFQARTLKYVAISFSSYMSHSTKLPRSFNKPDTEVQK